MLGSSFWSRPLGEFVETSWEKMEGLDLPRGLGDEFNGRTSTGLHETNSKIDEYDDCLLECSCIAQVRQEPNTSQTRASKLSVMMPKGQIPSYSSRTCTAICPRLAIGTSQKIGRLLTTTHPSRCAQGATSDHCARAAGPRTTMKYKGGNLELSLTT